MTALDQMVCFSLYSASRATTQAYRRLLERWGLTYPQYLVLVELWTQGPRSVRQLGDDLALDSGTLSPLLRRMETAGIVTRSRDRAHGRVVIHHNPASPPGGSDAHDAGRETRPRGLSPQRGPHGSTSPGDVCAPGPGGLGVDGTIPL